MPLAPPVINKISFEANFFPESSAYFDSSGVVVLEPTYGSFDYR